MSAPADWYALTRAARRLLVIEPGMLGDTIHLLPALWELRRNYPQAELHVLCSPVGAEVLRLAGCTDRLWTLEQHRQRRRVTEQFRVLRALRSLRFEASINFNDHDRNVIHAGLIGARHRLGQRRGNWHFWSRWCIQHWAGPPDRQRPVFEQRRQMLAACGLSLQPAQFQLRPPAADAQWAEENIPTGSVHLSINAASTPLNEWPLEHSVELGKILFREHPGLHLIASASAQPREQERMARFRAQLDHPRLKILPPDLAIARLTAALQRCRLHLGPDSGVVHLAGALGVPTLSLFRESAGRAEWRPTGLGHRHFTVACACYQKPSPDCLARGRAECLAGITPSAVATAVGEMLAG